MSSSILSLKGVVTSSKVNIIATSSPKFTKENYNFNIINIKKALVIVKEVAINKKLFVLSVKRLSKIDSKYKL